MLILEYGPVMMEYTLRNFLLERSLIDSLSIEDPDSDDHEMVYFINDELQLIPTGLLDLVKAWAIKNEIELELRNWPDHAEYGPVTADLIPGITLRDYQVDTIKRCITAVRGIVEIATGGGKTEIAIGLTLAMGIPNTIFMCPDVNSMRGMYDRYIKRGFTPEQVGRVGGGFNEYHGSVTIACVASLYSGVKRGNSHICSIMENCELLIADEVHHKATASSWQKVATCCRAHYRFGLSGTPYKDSKSRNNSTYLHHHDSWLTAFTGGTICSITPASLQALGMLTECVYIPFPAGGADIRTWKWHSVHKYGIELNTIRNLRIVTIATNLVDLGYKPLISIGKLSHGRLLQYSLDSRGVSAVCSFGGDVTIIPRRVLQFLPEDTEWSDIEYDLPFKVDTVDKTLNKIERSFVQISPNVDLLEIFRLGLVDILIGSSIYDESSDIPFLTDLINASGGKSGQRWRQKIGRVLRRYKGKIRCRVWDPYDTCHKYLKRHSEIRSAIVREEGYEFLGRDPSEMYSVLLRDIRIVKRIEEIEMAKITEIEVSCSMTLPYGDHTFIKPGISLRAKLEEGEDVDAAYGELSVQATALFLQATNGLAYYGSELVRKGPAQVMQEYMAQFTTLNDSKGA